MMNIIEKRASERKEFNKPVNFELGIIEKENSNNTVKFIKFEGKGVDISQGGIGVITKYPLKKGTIVKLSFPLDNKKDDLNFDNLYSVFAKTVWSKRINGSYRVGLSFLMTES